MLCFLLLSSLLAEPSADELLRRAIEAAAANDKKSEQYVFREHRVKTRLNRDGTPQSTSSETFENLFVEGDRYRRLIERDGQPLSAKEERKEQEKLAQTRAERQASRRNGLFHRTINLGGLDVVEKSYTVRLSGSEVVDGRDAWILDAVPKPGAQGDKSALVFDRRYWIDQETFLVLRERSEVAREGGTMLPGSVIELDTGVVQDDVRMPVRMKVDYIAQMYKVKGSGRQETTFSDFKKFDVQSTITIDPR
jgi:hypothetical protein